MLVWTTQLMTMMQLILVTYNGLSDVISLFVTSIVAITETKNIQLKYDYISLIKVSS